jgi:type I restriction enzyme M protein
MESITRIEEEQRSIDANKKLIQIYEQKIKEKIDEVWGR